MGQDSFFAMLSRMKYITRWGLMRNTREENLCEHTLETAILAHALAILRNRRFGGSVEPERAAMLALYHDASEIITGDLPTPVKYYNNELIAIGLADRAGLIRPLIPDVAAQITDVIGLFLPDPKQLVDRAL